MKKSKITLCILLALLLIGGMGILPSRAASETPQQTIERLQRELEQLQKNNDIRYNNLLEQYNKLLEEQKENSTLPRVVMNAQFRGVRAGEQAVLKVQVKNISGVNFSNGSLVLSAPPAGVALKNSSSTMQRTGDLLGGTDVFAEFPVLVSKEVKTGSYPIGFSFSAVYGKNNDKQYSFDQTFYIEITNPEEGKKKESASLSISNIVIPKAAALGQEFVLSFRVANSGPAKAEKVKITVEPGGNIINKSRNVFQEEVLEAGKAKEYSVSLYAPTVGKEEKADEKNHPIKITVESAPSSSEKEGAPAEGITLSQYADILILGHKPKEESENEGVKAPQLMVENYDYGGGYVEAGKNFTLNLTMVNTSKEKRLRNIKVSLTSEEGTFIPYNTSNSFYIDSMAPGARATKSITFSTKPDAKAQTIALNLDSAYEDMKGNALSAKDIISIPVKQLTKLDIDDAVLPPEVYAGQPVSLSFSFYNTGKNVLRNLKVTSEGNYDTQGNSSYFVGNMEPGKNDSYDLLLIPREPGEVSGTVTFSYEDVEGTILTEEKTFQMRAEEMPPMEEEMPQEMPVQKNYTPYYIGGAALLLLIVIIVWKKKRKKKKMQEMSIDE